MQVEARLSTDLAAFEILGPPNPPYRELASAISVPTLLVIGDKTIVTLEMARELRDGNPEYIHLEHIDDAGHGLPFDHPEQLGQLVLAFVRGLA